jgi:hypothetical protein
MKHDHSAAPLAHHVHPLDLRSRPATEAPKADAKRFDIFLIDTGWNEPVSKLVHSHLPVLYAYQKQDSLYILSREQSIEILRREPMLIGRDPTVLVYDLFAPRGEGKAKYRGFRIHLGRFRKPEQALSRLQEFLRFINQNRTAICLEEQVKRELHREGVAGSINILRELSEASIELI